MVISRSDEVFLLSVLRNSSHFICPSSLSRHNSSALSLREKLCFQLYGNDFWQLLISGWFTLWMNKTFRSNPHNGYVLSFSFWAFRRPRAHGGKARVADEHDSVGSLILLNDTSVLKRWLINTRIGTTAPGRKSILRGILSSPATILQSNQAKVKWKRM